MSDATQTSCFGCLATVPCPSLVAWLVVVVSMAMWCGSVMAGTRIAAAMFIRQNYIPVHDVDMVVVSVVCVTVVLASLFLLLASISSSPRCHSNFNTKAKVTCARVLNIITVVKSFLLCVVSMVVLVAMAVPLIFLLLLTYLVSVLRVDSINLKNYALSTNDYIIQGLELKEFYNKGQEVLICVSIASVAVIGCCIGLMLFMLFAMTNATRLQALSASLPPPLLPAASTDEEADATNHLHDSKNSIIDTKM